MPTDDRHELDVGLRVSLVGRVRLHREHADRAALDDERDAQPVAVGHEAQGHDLARGLELVGLRSGVTSWGTPVRSRYAVTPRASPTPNGSQTVGSGMSVSTVST